MKSIQYPVKKLFPTQNSIPSQIKCKDRYLQTLKVLNIYIHLPCSISQKITGDYAQQNKMQRLGYTKQETSEGIP